MSTNLTTPVVSITKEWMELVKRHKDSARRPTLIVFDSFYMDNATEELYLAEDQPFMGAGSAGRFKDVYALTSASVTKPGEWSAAYNKSKNELYVHH